MRLSAALLLIIIIAMFVLAACKRGSPGSSSGSSSGSSTGPCGMSPNDWCPSPPGDPCGAHKDVVSCKADKGCKGMPYRGESMVACIQDDAGFATNCPTVGCISR